MNSEKKPVITHPMHLVAPAPAESSGAMKFFIDFCAGGVAGAVAKTATAPIERVKLLIQMQDANPKIISGEVPRYTGIVNCFTRVAAEQGIQAFWRGNFVNVLRYFPTQAFNFAFKDTIKGFFPKYSPKTDFGKSFAVNVASGVGSGKAQFNGLIDCLSKTASGPAGPLGLYNGFGVSVVGIVPFRGTYFGVNDTLVSINPYQKDKGLVGIASKFVCAQTAALCAAYASYPFDTVRRRLQMQSEKPQEEWVYKGTMDCFGKIAAEEGVGALFKGAGANALRTVGSALVLVMYGELKGILAGAAGK